MNGRRSTPELEEDPYDYQDGYNEEAEKKSRLKTFFKVLLLLLLGAFVIACLYLAFAPESRSVLLGLKNEFLQFLGASWEKLRAVF